MSLLEITSIYLVEKVSSFLPVDWTSQLLVTIRNHTYSFYIYCVTMCEVYVASF